MAGRRPVECSCGHCYISSKSNPRCGSCGARSASTATTAEALREYRASRRQAPAPEAPAPAEDPLDPPEEFLPPPADDAPEFETPALGDEPAPVSALDRISPPAPGEVSVVAALKAERAGREKAERELQALRGRPPRESNPTVALSPHARDSAELRSDKERFASLRLQRLELQEQAAIERLSAPAGRGQDVALLARLDAVERKAEDDRRERRQEELRAREMGNFQASLKAQADRYEGLISNFLEPERVAQRAAKMGWSPPGAIDKEARSQDFVERRIDKASDRLDKRLARMEVAAPDLLDRINKPSPAERALLDAETRRVQELLASDPEFREAFEHNAREKARESVREGHEGEDFLDRELADNGGAPREGDPDELRRLLREAGS
jgi:hypothetical protein